MSAPAAALVAAAERLGVPVDREALDRRFDEHAAPQSLKALVEIAPGFGIEARAFQSDIAGLAQASLPAIVHLIDSEADETGFAILLEASPDRFVIEPERGVEPRVLTRSEFESCWSGIVVTLSVPEGVVRAPQLRRAGPLRRAQAWYRRTDPLTRLSFVAGRTGLILGAVFGLRSAWRFGGVAACIPVVLAVVALTASLSLFRQSRRALVPVGPSRLSASICGRGKFTDCLGVLASRYSRFAGIDWGSVGVAFFSASLALVAVGSLLGEAQQGLLYAWLAIACLCALPGSLVLTAVQLYPLRRFCPLCMAVHVAVIGSAAIGLAYLATGGWPGDAPALAPFAAAHLVALLAGFGLVVPYLLLSLESQVSRARLGWIGATPLGALAETAGRPRAVSTVPEAPFRIGDPSAPFRLEVLVHPMCGGCGPVVQKLRALEGRHAGRISIGFHLPPRDAASRADREMCAALAAVGSLLDGEQAVDVFQRVKNNPWPLLEAAEAGAEAIMGSLLPESVACSDAALAAGREAAEAADRLAETLERGTPTLLINGRFWDGSVEDLDALLARQPELLAKALRIPVGS